MYYYFAKKMHIHLICTIISIYNNRYDTVITILIIVIIIKSTLIYVYTAYERARRMK